MRNSSVQFVLQKWAPILEMKPNLCSELGKSIGIPTFEEPVIQEVCSEAQRVFARSDLVLHLDGNIYVVGDIHGNIFDLVRILIHVGPPPIGRYLFLGDYVDRGEYSVEVVTLLFAFISAYPEHVFMLRGNHEFDTLNHNYGFFQEVMFQYKSDMIYNVINDTFNWMPFVAILHNSVFCVHGGIAPKLTDLNQLTKLRRPIAANANDIIIDLTWSDPKTDTKKKEVDKSNRGLGVTFGVKPLKEFLNRFNCKMMVRAHQCVTNGIAVFGDGLLYTVFSCSNYVDYTGNKCGLMYFPQEGDFQPIQFPACVQIPRRQVKLQPIVKSDDTVITTQKNSLTLNVLIPQKKQQKKRGFSHSRSAAKFVLPLAIPHSQSVDYSSIRPKVPIRKSTTSIEFPKDTLPHL